MARSAGVYVSAIVCFLIGSSFALWPFWFSTDGDDLSRWLRFTGGFHPLVLHLPIGIVFAIAVFEVWSFGARKSESGLRRALWLIAALSASASFVTGYLLGSSGGHDEALLQLHLWFAGAFTALSWFALGLLLVKDALVMRIVTWSTAALAMTGAGHYGGAMVHGDPLANAPWVPDPTAIAILPPLGAEIAVYKDLVQPILTAKCQSCHGPGKQNGRLRLDSLERTLLGGAHGPALVPGRVKDSPLLQTVLLPLESEKHMPPKNRPQLNAPEIALLHWWIEAGASDSALFAAAEAPEVIKPFLVPSYRLLPDLELVARQEREAAEKKAVEVKRRAQLEAALAQLAPGQRERFVFTGEASADLEFAVSTSPEAFGDEELVSLGELLRQCVRITLADTNVTDHGLAQLRLVGSVRELNLKRTRVTAAAVTALADASRLEMLNLYATQVDDGLLTHMPRLPALRRLFLGDTRISDEAMAELRRKFPQAELLGSISTAVTPAPHSTP